MEYEMKRKWKILLLIGLITLSGFALNKYLPFTLTPDEPEKNFSLDIEFPEEEKTDSLPEQETEISEVSGQVFFRHYSLINKMEIDGTNQTGFIRISQTVNVTRNIAGTNQTRVISVPQDYFPYNFKVSPDGKKIIFDHPGGGDENYWKEDIYLATIEKDGSVANITKLTTDPERDIHPCWSPCGKYITFASRRDLSPRGYNQWGIYIMNADGSNQTKVPGSTDVSYSCWSPDGEHLVFSESGITPLLKIINLKTGKLIDLFGAGTNARWSPDGKSLVYQVFFSREGLYSWQIYRVDGIFTGKIKHQALTFKPTDEPFGEELITGPGPTPHSSKYPGYQNPVWSGCGRYIFCDFTPLWKEGERTEMWHKTPRSSIYRMDAADGNNKIQLTGTGTGIKQPFWAQKPPNENK